MYSIQLLHGVQRLDHGVEWKEHQMVSIKSERKKRSNQISTYIIDPDPNKQFSKIEQDSLFHDGKLHPSITVIGNERNRHTLEKMIVFVILRK